MREQEHMCEPYSPAMVIVHAKRVARRHPAHIVDWAYEVCEQHAFSMRPGSAGNLLAATQLATTVQAVDAPFPLPLPEGGGDRNAIPLYRFGTNARVDAPLLAGDAAARLGDARRSAPT